MGIVAYYPTKHRVQLLVWSALQAIKPNDYGYHSLRNLRSSLFDGSGILKLSRSEVFALVNLSEFVANEVKEASDIAALRRITIELQNKNNSSYYIRGSSRELHTLLSNLLQMLLITHMIIQKWRFFFTTTTAEVTLHIKDKGIGIPKETYLEFWGSF